MNPRLEIRVGAASELSEEERADILALCTRAFEEDMAPYFATFVDPVHVLGYADGVLVSHALWITRWLQIGDGALLRTAYVEAVCTDVAYRGRGYATAIMRRVVEEIQDYTIAALSPFSIAYYAELGWDAWQGPLFERTDTGVVQSPLDEEVMIYRLPQTPGLDLAAPMSIEWRKGEVW